MEKRTVLALGFLVIFFNLPLYAQSNTPELTINAIERVKTLIGWPVDEQVTQLVLTYQDAQFDQYEDEELAQYVFNDLSMHKWGNTITEFMDLMSLLYSFQDQDYQDANITEFQSNLNIIDEFRGTVNQMVIEQHPGLNLRHHRISKFYKGNDIKVAVFDVFDSNIYTKQIAHYQDATFEPINNFGDPVNLNHGNSVIDVLLQVAPEITIVPVSAESSTYIEAMRYILGREDIQIVNMSRAFAERDGELDPEFSKLLQQVLKTKIVVKSLGNTGTDLDENLSPIRVSQDLPPLGSLFSYDLALIKSFLPEPMMQPEIDHL